MKFLGGINQLRSRLIPKGYHAVTPYLSVQGAARAIAFYKKVFGAKEVMRMPGPGGTIGHAEIQIGDSRIMLADEYPEMNFRSPRSVGGTPVNIHLYVPNVDKTAKKAAAGGAKLLRPVAARRNPYSGHTDEGVEKARRGHGGVR
jgi:PhnB protein